MVIQVVGIDPSLTATGVSTSRGEYTIKTDAKRGDERLLDIELGLVRRLAAAGLYYLWEGKALAVLEDLPFSSRMAGKLGMVQGVIRKHLIQGGIPFITVPPATLKKYATNSGRATKGDMLYAYHQVTGIETKDDNQADAFFLREIGLSLVSIGGGGLETLEKVASNKVNAKVLEALKEDELVNA